MLSLNECSKVLNKSEKGYNDDEVKLIRDFLYKIGELGYNLFKVMSNKTRTIERWDELSKDLGEAWTIILKERSLGIEIICSNQPITLRGAFSKLLLAYYLINPHEEDDT
jgi:hypothetical protein